MSDTAWVFCGKDRLPVPRADAFVPPARLPSLPDIDAALEAAMAAPLGAPRLRSLARGVASVAIVVPDASRPCPTPSVLRHLLAELREAGVPDDCICVVIGCGLHAPTSAATRTRLVGADVSSRLNVVDAHGIESPSVMLGRTSLGAPVHIVRTVAEAELTITVGVVEPHLYAGFSGGVKGVAIGCAGQATIAWTHRPAFISLPGVSLCSVNGNPFRETLAEITAHTSLRWGVNAVMNERGRTAAVAAGDPALVQSTLATEQAGAWLHFAGEPFDIIVAGVHAPKSDNLYQASRAATYACLTASPALVDGGLMVLCADLPEAAGEGPAERRFIDLLQTASPSEIVARGLHEALGPGGQRAFVVARVLERYRIAIVGAQDPGFLAPLSLRGVTAADSVDAAVALAQRGRRERVRVLAIADAMTTVARSGSPPAAIGQNGDTEHVEVGG